MNMVSSKWMGIIFYIFLWGVCSILMIVFHHVDSSDREARLVSSRRVENRWIGTSW
jgi:hypothetical protein